MQVDNLCAILFGEGGDKWLVHFASLSGEVILESPSFHQTKKSSRNFTLVRCVGRTGGSTTLISICGWR